MRNIKFKNAKILNRYKIMLTVIMTFSFVFYFSSRVNSFISTNVDDYLRSKVKSENLLILKEAFSYLVKEETSMENLVDVVKNSKDEIVNIDFDIKECTKLLSYITSHINEEFRECNYIGYRLDVPLNFIGKSPLFLNIGPKIPVKIELSNIALGNVRTQVRDFGINNALLEIYLDVSINTSILYPLSIIEEKSSYEALVFSTMISGVVPNFYGGSINSKSDTISLPLDE